MFFVIKYNQFHTSVNRINIVTILINVSDLCAQGLFFLYILQYLEGSMRTRGLNNVETVQSIYGSSVVRRVLLPRKVNVHKLILYEYIYGRPLHFVHGC